MVTSKRVMIIIQLCLVFTLFGWIAGRPFSQDHFAVKSRAIMYQFVMGQEDGNNSQHQRNSERFALLPSMKKNAIKADYQKLHNYASRSFFSKLTESIKIVFIETSPFLQAWLFFALVICVFALLRIEGALQTAWILPLITAVYAFDNYYHGETKPLLPEDEIFPSEEVITSKYLDNPLSKNILDQEQQLRKGWQNYLVAEWTQETPKDEKSSFAEQVEEGEFAFMLARLDAIEKQGQIIPKSPSRQKEPLFFLLMYCAWNLYFAWYLNRK